MASGVAAFPSAYNVYVPDTEATGNLRIQYTRNPKKFAVNQYAQVVQTSKLTGYYTEMTAEEAGRILNDADVAWPEGAPRPLGLGGTESFKQLDYRCQRRAYTVTLGNMTIDQATWDVAKAQLDIQAQRAITHRSILALTAMTTSGNYASTHTSTATALAGGTWAASTAANQYIKKSLMEAANVIDNDTLGSVDVSQMQLVLSPKLAGVMAASGEIADYLKSSAFSGPVITGDWAGPSTRGLPATLYGFKVVVENTSRTTSRRGATAARSYVLANDTAVLCSRVGGLEASEGPTFSSVTLFSYRDHDMTVLRFNDTQNERVILSVVDSVDAKMTAPSSAYLFTGCQ
jgi:hypothetical protein